MPRRKPRKPYPRKMPRAKVTVDIMRWQEAGRTHEARRDDVVEVTDQAAYDRALTLAAAVPTTDPVTKADTLADDRSAVERELASLRADVTTLTARLDGIVNRTKATDATLVTAPQVRNAIITT